MFTIKHYNDGDRLVVVFEGLDNIPSAEAMMGTYLSGIGGNVIKGKPAEAAPIKQTEEPAPKMPSATFADGPYKGKTPAEAISCNDPKEQNQVFQYFCNKMENTTDAAFKDEILKAVSSYLKKRYENCEPEEYSKKLSDKQVKLFYIMHDVAINRSVKTALCKTHKSTNWTAFILSDISVLRSGIVDIITAFKNL